MPHEHPICDSDKHFIIDPITRNIINQSSKITIMQYDHNSERFTFEIPKFIECHDMSLCNSVRIHFINIGSIKTNTNSGVYEVDDVAVSLDDPDTITFSWLIKGSSTKYNGSLNFAIRFYCISDENVIDYSWGTNIYSGIKVSNGLENSDMIVEDYVDVLEKWKQEVIDICIQPATKTNLGRVKVGANLSITEDGTLSADASVQSDWNQNDSTAADYVKNRPFYAGDPVETVFVEERTELFNEDYGIYIAGLDSTFRPTDGDIYTVYWDGTVYECACVEDVDSEGKPMYYIGNLSILDYDPDTGEPFIFEIYNDGFISVSTKDTSASHTFSISRIDIEIVKIPTKYLPVASEIEPGIMSVNYLLQQVENEYFYRYTSQVLGSYYDKNIIEKCARYNNSHSIYLLKKFEGAVLSCYDDAVNKNITFVLSDSEDIECWKFSESKPFREKLWGIYKDGVVISSSTTDSTKKFKITVDDGGVPSFTNIENSLEVWTPSDSGSGLEPPIKTGSLLRGDADNANWSEVNADGGYGWRDVKEINFTSDMYDAAEKVTYTETDSGGNETEVTAFVKISDDVITMEEAESICALMFITDGEPVVYDFTQSPYNKIQQVGTTGISLYYGHIFSCSQAEDAKDLFGVETPVMVPAGTWLLNELTLEASYYPFKVSHGIKHIIDKSYLPDSEPVRYIYSAEFSKLASDLRSGKTVILTDYSLRQGGRIINFGGDMKTYITLTYDSSPSAKYKYVQDDLGNIYFGSHTSVEATNAELYLKSSTADSTKTFKITVDDSGTISATEVT